MNKTPLELAKDLLRMDDPENYATEEAVGESILSELEAKMEVSTDEADAICTACEEWYNEEK